MEEIAKGYEKLSEIENYKQINNDLETAKTNLIDYNKNVECNLFGVPLTKFYPNVTGQKPYKSRLTRGLIKELQYPPPQYLPNTTHLVGSSMCPRPISIPFINQVEKSDKLIDKIKEEEIFNLLRNKKMFDSEKPITDNKGLPSYFCVKLGADSPKTRKHLIDLFEECIQKKKKEYNNDPKYYLKDSFIKGLTDYKNYLQNNLTKNMFNGKKIPYTKQKDINNKFKIVKKLVKKEGWNKMHLERQNINHDTYAKLYQVMGKGIRPIDNNNKMKKNFSSINFNENRYMPKDENENIVEKEKYYETNIKNDKDDKDIKLINALISPREKEKDEKNKSIFNYIKKKSRQKILYDSNLLNGNKSKANFNYSSFQSNYNKSMNKLGSTVTTCFNYGNESKISKNIFPITKDIYSPKRIHHFQRSLSNFNTQKNNLKKINDEEEEENKNEDKKNIEDEETFDVDDSQDIEKKKKILRLNEMIKNCEHENKLMKGYQPEHDGEDFEENIKRKPPNFVSPVAVYKKEIEMFRKVNPIEYERELNKKLLDDKMILKKLQNRRIYERIKIKK